MKKSEFSAIRGTVRSRGTELLRAAACWMLVALLAGLPIVTAEENKSAATPTAASAVKDTILKTMQNEIARARAEMGKNEKPPHYPGDTAYDQGFWGLLGGS